MNPCTSSNICLNGGTCYYTGGSAAPPVRACACAEGFYGDVCENGPSTTLIMTTSDDRYTNTYETTTSSTSTQDNQETSNRDITATTTHSTSQGFHTTATEDTTPSRIQSSSSSTHPDDIATSGFNDTVTGFDSSPHLNVVYDRSTQSTQTETEGTKALPSSNPNTNSTDLLTIVIIVNTVLVAFIILGCVIIIVYCFRRKANKRKREERDSSNATESEWATIIAQWRSGRLKIQTFRHENDLENTASEEPMTTSFHTGHPMMRTQLPLIHVIPQDLEEIENEVIYGYERVVERRNEENGQDNDGYDSLEFESDEIADDDLNGASGLNTQEHGYDPVHTPTLVEEHPYEDTIKEAQHEQEQGVSNDRTTVPDDDIHLSHRNVSDVITRDNNIHSLSNATMESEC